MIAFVEGEIVDIENDNITVLCGGLGYRIQVPGSVTAAIAGTGEFKRIYTHMYVREDAIGLYGFLSKDDLAIFRQLITVSGIGPKGALALLTVMDADALRMAIISEDVKAITAAPGIGAKIAKRLIMELKDKIDLEAMLSGGQETVPAATASVPDASGEVIMALTALGYSNSEAMKAVRSVPDGKTMDEQKLLKEALKRIMVI